MKQVNKNVGKIVESLKNNSLVIFSGIYTMNKNYIMKKTIERLQETFNCIVLDFNILNLNRCYTINDSIAYVNKQIKNNTLNIVVILEFTNIENWNKLLESLLATNNIKVVGSTSFNFNNLLTQVKYKKFKVSYKEIMYYPPTYNEFFLESKNQSFTNYFNNGSILVHDDSQNDDNMVALISNLNLIRLFNIVLILTKIRNHYQLEIFFSFLIKNIDQKLTLEFIKNEINKETTLPMNNIKLCWKFMNMLQNLYIIIPISTYSTTRKQTRFNSRFVCADHMVFKVIDNVKNLNFKKARNIIITEFLKRKHEVNILEENQVEIGFFAYINESKKILIAYEKDSNTIKKFIEKESLGTSSIFYLDKNIEEKKLSQTLTKLTEILENEKFLK